MGFIKGRLSWLGNMLKPLWKGAAKKVLASQASGLRARLKAMVDDDSDASIQRVNRVFDSWQEGVIAGLKKLTFLPASIVEAMADGVQREGDIIQAKVVAGIKDKGPHAIDLAFEGIEVKLNALIDAA